MKNLIGVHSFMCSTTTFRFYSNNLNNLFNIFIVIICVIKWFSELCVRMNVFVQRRHAFILRGRCASVCIQNYRFIWNELFTFVCKRFSIENKIIPFVRLVWNSQAMQYTHVRYRLWVNVIENICHIYST